MDVLAILVTSIALALVVGITGILAVLFFAGRRISGLEADINERDDEIARLNALLFAPRYGAGDEAMTRAMYRANQAAELFDQNEWKDPGFGNRSRADLPHMRIGNNKEDNS